MNLFFKIMIFGLGLCIGSFINMAVYRVGEEVSFFKKKRSFCDFCKINLKWQDNIPVWSWLRYGGKSRCCGKKLPLLYPIVEVMTGILFLLNYELGIVSFGLIINFLIISLLVFEAAFDFKYMMLPDVTAWALIGLALVKLGLAGFSGGYLISALISGIFIFILHKIKIKGKEAMGDGDILLAVFMGLFLGFPNIVVAFYVAFIAGAVVGAWLIWRKKVRKLSPIPFGPFLILGTVVAWLAG
ncbi:prepilin peptidase, partial [Patescibacteria group bacterium]|nr:prepilin peptidase [Patescibacteria group bacterium]